MRRLFLFDGDHPLSSDPAGKGKRLDGIFAMNPTAAAIHLELAIFSSLFRRADPHMALRYAECEATAVVLGPPMIWFLKRLLTTETS